MALVVADRVKETTTTTGTGAITLAGAEVNFVAFSSVLSDGDTTYYAIVDDASQDFEVGLGTYATSGNTLTRTTVLASSNGGSAVDLSAGSKEVFINYPAGKSVYLNDSGQLVIGGTAVTSTAVELNILDGVTATTAEINILDGVTASTAEINILDGVTASTAEINILDGVTSTTAELNLVDGSSANTVVNSKAVIYGSSGEITSTQLDITGQGDLRLQDSTGGEYVGLQAPATVGSSFTLTLPSADGSSGQVLKTDGSGALSFGAGATVPFQLTLISGQNFATTNASQIEFTGLDNSYDYYLLFTNALNLGSQQNPDLHLSSNNGTSYAYDGADINFRAFMGREVAGWSGESDSDNNRIWTNSDKVTAFTYLYGIGNSEIVRFTTWYHSFDDSSNFGWQVGKGNNSTNNINAIRYSFNATATSGAVYLYGVTI